MRDRLKHWQVGVLLAAVVGFAIAPMLERSYPLTHSTHFNLIWAFQYQRQFFSGQFYPRWLEFSNFGFGNATFVFYPPLSMVATLPFRMMGLGVVGSLIASMAAAIALLGIGLYRLTRRFYPRWVSLTVALTGMMSPYFTIDIYQRGAIGEVWAIATLPWILLASQQVIERASHPPPRRRGVRWGLDPDWDIVQYAIAYGALVLSHLPTLLIFTLLWLPLPWAIAPSKRRLQAVLRSYSSLAIAWSVTAFFLLPVAIDGRLVQLEALYATLDYLPQNRLLLSGLWWLNPDLTNHWFDRKLIAPWAMMGVMTLGAIVGYSVDRWVAAERSGFRQRRTVLYWSVASAIALLMTTDLLGWLYLVVPPLQRIQFSWRWLSVATVLVPLLLGDSLYRVARCFQPTDKRLQIVKGALAVLLWGIVAWHGFQGMLIAERAVYAPATLDKFARLSEAKQFPEEPRQRPGTPFLGWHWIYPDGLAFVDVYEYRAKGVTLPMPPDRVYPLVEWQDGRRDGLAVERWNFGLREFVTNNTTPVERIVRLRTFNYPGWFARLDAGRWQPLVRRSTVEDGRTSGDRLELSVPPGLTRVTVMYRGTRAERWGAIVSFVASVTLVGGVAIASPISLSRRGNSPLAGFFGERVSSPSSQSSKI
ncbi:hypothetical protein POG22_16480 [Geitlerinema sp. CS-897]|nr:hypothetical protein [Geitlerinema sp. CS-897]